MKPRVLVTRAIPEAGLALLRPACEMEVWPEAMPPPYEVLEEKIRGMDGLLCMLTDRIDGSLMDAAGPQLKVISQMAVGYDNIDAVAARERGIPVGNTPGVLTDATADLAFALLLAGARRLMEGVEYIKTGQWRTWSPTALLGFDVAGSTLGIVGLGRIGSAVARRAQGFDMRVIAHSPRATAEMAAQAGVELVSMDDLLAQADFVSLHVPLNAQTRHLMNQDTLRKMKSTAVLINTTRGGVVDQEALYEALTTGIIGAAALDVTDPEPLRADHPLLNLPNALIVPHIGSASVKTREKMAVMAAKNLLAGVRGEPLPTSVK